MDISNLEYIVEVAKCGSIMKASENLFITPSALSQHVKSVETKLGCYLFYRTGKRFALTYAGERYIHWAEKILEMSNTLEKELSEIKYSDIGRIRIGFPPSYSRLVTSMVIPELKSSFPRAEIHLEEDSTVALQQRLLDNEIDLILTNTENPSAFPRHIIIEKEEIVLAVPRGHHLIEKSVRKSGFRRPWIDLDLCRSESFILLKPNQYLRQIADKILHKHCIDKPITMQLKNIKSVLDCVEEGLGITFMFDKSIHEDDRKNSISFLSFGDKRILRNFIIAYNIEQESSKIIDSFVSIFKKRYIK